MLPTNVQFAGVAFIAFVLLELRRSALLNAEPPAERTGLKPLAEVALTMACGAVVVALTYAQLAGQIVDFYRKLDDHFQPAAQFMYQAFAWWFLHSHVAGDIGTTLAMSVACLLLPIIGWSSLADLVGVSDIREASRRVVVATIGGYMCVLIALNYAAGMSLGFVRNRVDVFLFFLLAAALSVDHAVAVLRRRNPARGRAAEVTGAAAMWAFAILLLPRTDYVYSDNVAYQSAIGPFIRQLVATDADREWRFQFSPQVNFCAEIVEYYAAVRPTNRVLVCQPRYETHMGVSGPQAARDWKAAVTTKPPNVYVRRSSRDSEDQTLAGEWSVAVQRAGLRFDLR